MIFMTGQQCDDLALHLHHEVVIEWGDLVLVEPVLKPGFLPDDDVQLEQHADGVEGNQVDLGMWRRPTQCLV